MTREELENLRIRLPSEEIYRQIKADWDGMAKPLDGMGRFEEYVAQIGAIFGQRKFDIRKKAVVVMCADNGVVREGVSQSGQDVTRKVAAGMGKGKTSVCRMAESICADVFPVDIGINHRGELEGVLGRKAAMGTRDFLEEPAMTEEEMSAAIRTGMEMVCFCKEQGYRLIATGEMGIGNTTTSAAMAAAMTGCSPAEVTGRGAGLDDERLEKKRLVISRALDRYAFRQEETFRILQTVGGLDIAGMTGLFLGGARYHIPIVMDGVISMVAALTAKRIRPEVVHFIIPSHKSREPACERILKELGAQPVLDASMALGEGTGAVMMFALLDMAVALYTQNSGFEDIGVQQYTRYQEAKRWSV